MTTCTRCGTVNTRSEQRCKACWFDLRSLPAETSPPASPAGKASTAQNEPTATAQAPPEVTAAPTAPQILSQHAPPGDSSSVKTVRSELPELGASELSAVTPQAQTLVTPELTAKPETAEIPETVGMPPPEPAKLPLAGQLELKAAHVKRLAEAKMLTLEHLAQAGPEEIARALWPWPHIDPESLITRAKDLLAGLEAEVKQRSGPVNKS